MITFNLRAEGYRILVEWEGISDTTVYLAHYYDSKTFVDDTLKLDENGKGVFTGDSMLHEGLYLLYLKDSNFFDFLLGDDQTLEIKTNNSDILKNLVISGSEQSQDFLNYQRLLKDKVEEKKAISEKLDSLNDEEKKKAIDKLNSIDQEMVTFMKNEIQRSNNNMYGTFLNTAHQLLIPDPEVEKDHPKYDSIAWFHAYNYRRDHFLDGIDFTDDRILYTPILKNKLETYFNKFLIQSPDSIIPQAIKVIRESESNKKMYQYTSQFFLNNSVQSKIMGMDAVFVAIADEVYLSGKATWTDAEILKKITEEVYLTRPNLIGNKAPELTMENIDGEMESLYMSQGEYTILVFYEYDCGHCKKDIPALYNDVYLKFIENNIEVYAVCMNDDKEKWEDFVEKNELAGWHHLWDPNHITKFRFKYNTKTAPTMYLLDKEKIIKAKKLDNASLTKLLNALLREN